jgi:hypothetical protein
VPGAPVQDLFVPCPRRFRRREVEKGKALPEDTIDRRREAAGRGVFPCLRDLLRACSLLVQGLVPRGIGFPLSQLCRPPESPPLK